MLVSGSAVTAVAAKSSPQLETLEESLSHPELLQCVSARDYPRCAQGSGRSSLNQAANHCTRQHGGYTAPGSFHVSMVNNRLPVPTFLATLSQSSNQCTLHVPYTRMARDALLDNRCPNLFAPSFQYSTLRVRVFNFLRQNRTPCGTQGRSNKPPKRAARLVNGRCWCLVCVDRWILHWVRSNHRQPPGSSSIGIPIRYQRHVAPIGRLSSVL